MAIGSSSARLQGGHRAALLRGGAQLFPAMQAAIAQAQHEVWIASYIVHTDAASQSLLECLMRAARQGVRVRLVVDGFGSRHAVGWWRQRMQGSGVALAVFRPIDRWWHWLRPGQLRRLHQKLCVVDGRVAFVGGINLIDDRIDLRHGALDAPRLDYAMRMEGAVVADVERQLRRLWMRTWLGRDFGDELLGMLRADAPLRRLGAWLRQRWRGAYERVQERRRRQRMAIADHTPVRLAYVPRDNLRHRHAIEREYLQALRGAQQRFDLICPYFYPSRRLLYALTQAARRGVQVRVLLQGQFDYRFAAWAARALYAQLLAQGVRVYEYRAAFLHAKVALADDDWFTLGSSNLDPTSLLLNLEANLVVSDGALCAQLRCEFDHALDGSHEIVQEQAALASRGLGAWMRRTAVAWVAQMYLRVAGGSEPY